jgi:hypothetical protein
LVYESLLFAALRVLLRGGVENVALWMVIGRCVEWRVIMADDAFVVHPDCASNGTMCVCSCGVVGMSQLVLSWLAVMNVE